MKKTIFIVGTFAIFGLIALSCKKDRVCTCTTTTTGFFSGTVSGDTIFSDVSKKDAKTKCSSLESNGSYGGQTWTTTCELK